MNECRHDKARWAAGLANSTSNFRRARRCLGSQIAGRCRAPSSCRALHLRCENLARIRTEDSFLHFAIYTLDLIWPPPDQVRCAGQFESRTVVRAAPAAVGVVDKPAFTPLRRAAAVSRITLSPLPSPNSRSVRRLCRVFATVDRPEADACGQHRCSQLGSVVVPFESVVVPLGAVAGPLGAVAGRLWTMNRPFPASPWHTLAVRRSTRPRTETQAMVADKEFAAAGTPVTRRSTQLLTGSAFSTAGCP